VTAIQRWYWMPGMAAGDHDLGPMPDGAKQWNGDPVPLSEQWCKAKDVAELERVIAERSISHDSTVEGLRRQLHGAKERIESLEHIAMGMQSDAKVTAENYVMLQATHTSLQHRYDLLMQRTKKVAE
jgi:hypothetical protein